MRQRVSIFVVEGVATLAMLAYCLYAMGSVFAG